MTQPSPPPPTKDREFSWRDMDCDDDDDHRIKLVDDGAATHHGDEPLASYFGMMPSLSSSSIASSVTSSGTAAEAEPELSQSLGSTSSFDLRTPLKQSQAHNHNLVQANAGLQGFPIAYPTIEAKMPSSLTNLPSGRVVKPSATSTLSRSHDAYSEQQLAEGAEWRLPFGGAAPMTPASARNDGAGAGGGAGSNFGLDDDLSPTRTSSATTGRDSQPSSSSMSASSSPMSKMHTHRPKLSLPLLAPSAFSRPNIPQTPGGSLCLGARDGAATGAPMSPFVPPTPLVASVFSKDATSRQGFFDGTCGDSASDTSPSPTLQKRQSMPMAVSTPKQPRLTHIPLQRHGSIGMSPLSSEFANVSMRADSRSSDLMSSEAATARSSSTVRTASLGVEASPSDASTSSKVHTPPYSPLFLGRSLQDGSCSPGRLSSTSSGIGGASISSNSSSSKKRAKDAILGGGAGMARSFSASRIKTSRAKAAPKPFNLTRPTIVQRASSSAQQQPMSAPLMKISFSEQQQQQPQQALGPVPEIRGAIIDSPGQASVVPPVPSPSLLSPHTVASKPLHGGAPMEKSFSAPPKPAQTVSARHLANHRLHPIFAKSYTIRDELGSGGFGFVVSATRNADRMPVAVKFIFKEKVPAHGWVRDPKLGVIPMEAFVLKVVDHPGVVKFIDLFDDDLYFYLVMELHGTPWKQPTAAAAAAAVEAEALASTQLDSGMGAGHPGPAAMQRRTSCDLFECIEQHSRLSEEQARWVFAQVVEVVWHLDRAGICHRDIKDENCVVDADFNVKLIDFGSAVITDVRKPTPYFNRFFGTMTFASSEILQGKPYRAPHAEIWSLGVLLSILLSGECPFADPTAAIKGRISKPKGAWSPEALSLLFMCLEVNPDARATIQQIRAHPWVRRAWTDRGRL
ncbi:related to serine/threonine-protein kinase [Pseudozyma flocculosa]|nr:related to serine/threonine-protein kinase [Pseudozyma flocculosa]